MLQVLTTPYLHNFVLALGGVFKALQRLMLTLKI